jgi:hypothetical protein
MYKLLKDRFGDQAPCVLRTVDSTCIPFDTDNTDYQAYLAWLEEGNTPEPAEGAE